MATEFPIRANTKNAVKDITALENALRKAGKEANLTEKEIDDIVKGTKNAKEQGGKNLNEVNKSLNNIHGTALKVGGAVLAMFAVDKIKAFVGEVVSVTAEFQKLSAVLTNTLGSKSAAQRSLKEIRDLAASTPFSVRELTENYVKLANRGIKPTTDQMTKMGDVAAALGKPFEQIVEAILDINNPERWKEIGIKSETAGNKVRLSFRDATFEVNRTIEGVTDAVTAIGEMEGVAGSMAAISATLGGQISNLGDSYDSLLNTIGDGNNGVLSGAVGLMKDLVEGIEQFLKTRQQLEEEIRSGAAVAGIEDFKAFAQAYNDVDKALKQYLIDQENEIDNLRELNFQAVHQKEFDNEEVNRRVGRIERLIEQNKAVKEYVETLKEENKLKANRDADQAKLDRLKAEKDAYDKLLKARAKFLESFLKEGTEDLPLGDPARLLQDSFLTDKQRKQLESDTAGTEGKIKGEYDEEINALFAKTNMELKIDEEANQKKKDGIDNLKQYSIMALEEVFQSRVVKTQRELALLENQYHHELSLAGNNEDAKAKLNREFEQQRIALLNKQAEQEKIAGLFSMAVNQGPAIVKAISTAPFPINLGIGAVIAALIGVQLANARKLQTPRFAAEGEFNIQGPGTTTSDSIPYMLSREESVVKAERSKRFGWLLQPMIENKAFDEYDLRNLVDQKLPNQYNPVFVASSHDSISHEQIERLERIEKAITRKKETHLTYDEEGFNIWVGNENNWTRRRNRRYST